MEGLRTAFLQQADHCIALGSPFMGQLCRVLAKQLRRGSPLTDRLFDWQGDIGPGGDSVPLRLCGALHALRLSGDRVLDTVYPPAVVSDDDLWRALDQTFRNYTAQIDAFIDNPPQTNEVRRASALIAAAHKITEYFPNPMRVSELGASAGLNLSWNRFALQVGDTTYGPTDAALTLRPDWTGNLPPMTHPRVVERRGVDLNPVDPIEDSLRLRAYLWPDQPHRLELTDAALDLPPAPVDQGDAIDWLAPRLPHISGQTHMIYTTVAWQYFPAEKQKQGLTLIQDAGATATPDSPLAFVQMENDGAGNGAALTLRLWPGDLHLSLGRVDFHGRWVDWAI
ncbi:DUF2332 family protein [Octadecabacter sp. 1_MG-2023]|uniref:DUF2332 domain-containing protein n=1 Tax=unclassified Octadecabacter TaxID=196158 RepID=UPI001C08948B|nr:MULTISPECIES: DUF2332 family protein [unclassified Octadecabacter]MBU2994580.1 DUF2332 family protein [Octadecabacter sp. B2R22]MDO6734127.1 DUF2332 family protein [Octadecabacter sp. 1_MG-2023]